MAARRDMREILVHIFYTYSLTGGELPLQAEQFLSDEILLSLKTEGAPYKAILQEADKKELRMKVDSMAANLCTIDAAIEQHAKGWKPERISKVIFAILRVAVHEILYEPLLDNSIAINEAVEIAKGYEEQEAVRFLNGILGSVEKEGAAWNNTSSQ